MNQKVDPMNDSVLLAFGFKAGKSGAHSARTMMLDELETLLSSVSARSAINPETLRGQIIFHNVLTKPTEKSRQLTFHHLQGLYSLSEQTPLFRVFRRLWQVDEAAHPMLALSLAVARDPILRLTKDYILGLPINKQIDRSDTEHQIRQSVGNRLSASSRRSYAQNVNGTWTQAGFLKGKVRKTRQYPVVTPANLAYNLFLAYLEGATGDRLFSSSWALLLDRPIDRLHELALIASQRGLLVYRRSGEVTEVRFPGYLTDEEMEMLQHE